MIGKCRILSNLRSELRPMRMKAIAAMVISVGLSFLLVACGQTGPLYLPKPKASKATVSQSSKPLVTKQ